MKAVSLVAVAVAGVCLIAATVRGEIISRGSGCAERRISLAVTPDLKVDGADGQKFRVYRLDERHRVLTEDGTWRAGERLVVPKDGFVLLTTVGLTSVKQPSAGPAVPLNGIEANDKKRK